MNTVPTTADYLAELDRELDMRRQVYPGRVLQRKMTQAAADHKTALLDNVAAIFRFCAEFDIDPFSLLLPIGLTGSNAPASGGAFSINTLTPHIKELAAEIAWRRRRIDTKNLATATRAAARRQLTLMEGIHQILQTIQTRADQAAEIASGQIILF